MDDFFGRRMRPWWPVRRFGTEALELTAPAVDLFEEKDDIVVKAELPGIDKENIEVNLTDHTLHDQGREEKGGGGQGGELLLIGAFLWKLREDAGAAERCACGQGQSEF